MQDVAYADSYTATRIAAAIAEPSSGRHLRYVTVMDPGVHPGSPSPLAVPLCTHRHHGLWALGLGLNAPR